MSTEPPLPEYPPSHPKPNSPPVVQVREQGPQIGLAEAENRMRFVEQVWKTNSWYKKAPPPPPKPEGSVHGKVVTRIKWGWSGKRSAKNFIESIEKVWKRVTSEEVLDENLEQQIICEEEFKIEKSKPKDCFPTQMLEQLTPTRTHPPSQYTPQECYHTEP